MNQEARDQRLRALWARRCELSEPEWCELWQIVHTELAQFHPPESHRLQSDGGESHQDLIEDFFMDKVWATRDGTSVCHHTGALRYFFRNYLRDRLAAYHRKQAELLPEEAASNLESEPETLELKEALWEEGLSIEHVRNSARNWLATQEPWVGLYLGLHYCPDKAGAFPLSEVARRYRIPSYHYKAKKLGIVWNGNDPALFKGTLLGQWLSGFGFDFKADELPAILAVLKILCLETLYWAGQYIPRR